MKKDQVFTDKDGTRWVSASKVADMWNQVSKTKGITTNYSRWSVYARRDDLEFQDTPFGRLFREDKATEIDLRPRDVKREDTAERNVQRGKKKGDLKEGDNNSSMILVGSTPQRSGTPAMGRAV